MKLQKGSTTIDTWSGFGTGALALKGTATVSAGKVYTLYVDATINGVVQPTVTVY